MSILRRTSPSAIDVVVGTTTLNAGGTVYTLERIITHAGYDYETIQNDVGLLRVTSAIVGSSTVTSIPIGSSYIGSGLTVTLSGWGLTSVESELPNDLQFINLRTISNDECIRNSLYPIVYDSSLCTFTQVGEGICNGDSGGPLVYNGILIGIVSWAVPCAIGYPDVFTRVSYYINWIQSNAT